MRPDDRKYLPSHEWCLTKDGVATLGISDHAVEHLSDLVFLDLPEVGQALTLGEPFGEIESVKAVSDLYSPITGEVTAVNDDLPENLDLLNSDAFGDGWMVKIKVSEVSPDLMDAAAYEEHLKNEE